MAIVNLVFQGGSIKGLAYIGALKSLYEQELLDLQSIKRIGGTSAGAITALMLALGCSIAEIEDKFSRMNLAEFLDEADAVLPTRSKVLSGSQKIAEGNKLSFFSGSAKIASVSPKLAYRVASSFGLYNGDFFKGLIEGLIDEKTGVTNLTFEELNQMHQQNPGLYKNLYVMGVNLSTSIAEVFSFETTPNVIIADAVRISMSIPFIFKPHYVCIKTPAGESEPLASGHLYADGGITNNYPISLFDKNKYLLGYNGDLPEEPIHNHETLGMRLVNKERKDFFEATRPAPEKEISHFLHYTSAVLASIYQKQESDHVNSADKRRTIYIDTLGINTLQFNLNTTQKNALIASGEEAARGYGHSILQPGFSY
jgi:NTE family protein